MRLGLFHFRTGFQNRVNGGNGQLSCCLEVLQALSQFIETVCFGRKQALSRDFGELAVRTYIWHVIEGAVQAVGDFGSRDSALIDSSSPRKERGPTKIKP